VGHHVESSSQEAGSSSVERRRVSVELLEPGIERHVASTVGRSLSYYKREREAFSEKSRSMNVLHCTL